MKPTRRQAQVLSDWLERYCEIYNAALQEPTSARKLLRKSVSPDVVELPVELAEPLRRAHRALEGFFRRVRRGQKDGYPRFRLAGRYYSVGCTAKVDGNLIVIYCGYRSDHDYDSAFRRSAARLSPPEVLSSN